MKKTSIILSSVFCLLSLGNSFAYTSSDVSNAQFLANQGIIVKQSSAAGYRLDNTITRAEVVGMALKIKGITLPSKYTCKNYFIDAPYNPSNNWICRAVELAADEGIISRLNSKTRPNDSITRAEALSIVLKSGNISTVLDCGDCGGTQIDSNVSWHRDVFLSAYLNKIISPEKRIEKFNAAGPYSQHIYRPSSIATRAEVFSFAKNILSSKNSCIVGPLQIAQPCEVDNGFIRYGQHIETITYGDDVYKGPECLISYEETGSNPIDALTGLSLVKYRAEITPYLDVQYIEAGGFRAVFTSTGYYRISSGGNVDNCMNVIFPYGGLSLYPRDVLRLYYKNLNTEGGSYWAYLMRSPAGVSLETFQGWYKQVTSVSFQENTLKDLGDNTYEFFVEMTENGIKSTYKVKSKVDLENFKINNISSAKQ